MGKEAAGSVEQHGVKPNHVVLVLDSGGSSCKLGISGDFDSVVYVVYICRHAASARGSA